jgi:hypothetical protein
MKSEAIKFSKNRHEKLVGWPVIKAYRYIYAEKWWVCFIPDINLRSRIVIPEKFTRLSKEKKALVVKRQEWSKWCGSIPADIFKLVHPLKNGQWMCLSVLARCGTTAGELFESNPALFFALANNRYLGIKNKNNMAFIRRALKYPRRKIAELLGFPGTEKTVSILKKVQSNELSTKMIFFLRKALNEGGPSVQYFSHLPAITAHTVSLSRNEFSSTVNYNLLESAIRLKGKMEVTGITVKLRETTNLYGTFLKKKMPLIRSVEELNKLHEELIKYFEPVKMGKIDVPLPLPPFKSDPEYIEQFTSTSRVFAESFDMRNCLKDHLEKLFSGKYYVLRILRQKITLMIKSTSSGLEVEDIKGFANRRLTGESVEYIRKELKKAVQTSFLDVSELDDNCWETVEKEEIPEIEKRYEDAVPF